MLDEIISKANEAKVCVNILLCTLGSQWALILELIATHHDVRVQEQEDPGRMLLVGRDIHEVEHLLTKHGMQVTYRTPDCLEVMMYTGH